MLLHHAKTAWRRPAAQLIRWRMLSTTAQDGGGMLEAYERLVHDGTLHPDGSQVAAVQSLSLLSELLASEAPNDSDTVRPHPIRGAYMFGPVGRGKLTIMRLFASTMPSNVRVSHVALPTLLAHFRARVEGGGGEGGTAAAASSAAAAAAASMAKELSGAYDLVHIDKLAVGSPEEARAADAVLSALVKSGAWLAFTCRGPIDEVLGGGDDSGMEFAALADAHLLPINVSGAGWRDWQGGGGKSSAAAAAPGEPHEPSRCHVGEGAGAALRRAWDELAAAKGAREGAAVATLRFFSGTQLWIPKALLPAGGGGGGGKGEPQQQHQQQQHHHHHDQQQQQAAGSKVKCGALNAGEGEAEDRWQAAADAAADTAALGAARRQGGAEHALKPLAAYFTFDELIAAPALPRAPSAPPPHPGAPAAPLTAVGALALAQSGVGDVFLEGVPALDPGSRDAAMRLATLVDVLYDHGVRLHVSAAAPPSELFRPLLAAALARGLAGHNHNHEQQQQARAPGYAERALLAEEVLACQRAAARLSELTSE